MAKSKEVKAHVVKNRIADVRKKAGLTRRALGARMATSQQQVERWEKGEEIAPAIAGLLALALEQPPEAVFPGLAGGMPTNEEEWHQLGFDLQAPLFTWEIEIVLRGFEHPFHYLVDRKDADRIANILDGDCEFDFIAFDSVGRSVHVSVKDIQYAQVLHEVTTLIPGVKYGAGELQPTFPTCGCTSAGARRR